MAMHTPKPGRPKLPESERKSVTVRVLVTATQYKKLLRLGGPVWIRERIEKAKE
jgi:hypothetical protein